jgi:hypothetical protein
MGGYLNRVGRSAARGIAALALAALTAVSVQAAETGPQVAQAPASRAAGSVDTATFWIFQTCPPGMTMSILGCACVKGDIMTDAGCVPRHPPAVTAPAPEAPKPQATTRPAAPKPVVQRKPKPQKQAPATPTPDGIAGFDTAGRPCVDADLYDLLATAYGPKPGLRACNAGCIARPTGTLRSAAELDALAKANGVAWCPESCIKVTGWMPPAEVLRLEKATGRSICPVDGQNFCRARDNVAVPMQTTIQRVLAFAPAASAAPRDSGDVALVIGMDGYKGPLPAGDHGRRDAEAVKTLLVEKLGYAPGSVIVAADLSAADFRKLIGPDGDLAKKKPTSSIFLYVSGHGMSDPATGAAYLLPVDADPANLAGTALSLQDVYEALGSIGAPSIMVALEAAFPSSLSDLIDPPNLPGADVAVLPARAIPGLSVFTAADRDQQTLVDPDLGTGLFTRYLLEGLAGAADGQPTGNGDRRIESVELYVFTAHRVRVTARKSFGLEQKPLISESTNALVRSF